MRSDIPISQTPIAGSDDLREELSLLFKFLVAVEEKNPVDRASEAQKLYTKWVQQTFDVALSVKLKCWSERVMPIKSSRI